MLKILQADFSNMSTVNFQMFKLVLEKAEEPEIKLPTSTGSSKKAREFQKNIYFCFIDYAKAFDCVDHNKLWKILYASKFGKLSNGHRTSKDQFPIQKKAMPNNVQTTAQFHSSHMLAK